MILVQAALLIVYGGLLLFIFLYSLMQINLVFNYLRSRRKGYHLDHRKLDFEKDEVPFVTIQLPIFNEKYVVQRLIDAVAAFDYPKDRMEIQVLDDSTDETVDITAEKVAEVRKQGILIEQVRRSNRQGFKAGALAEGMETAKGEFIAIFDADFVPKPDFLKCTIPFFENDRIGVVQTRWEHINKDYSMLTKLQAFGLDAHFSVEQAGRNESGHFINFNGTAGIWRKECISDAGGWQSDTLTEDLDLSYRAQLKGWKFKYLEGIGSPAELPAAMNALKTQQFRWTKGAAECARKNLGKVVRSKEVNLSTKVHASFHLLNSFLFICIITTALLSIPLLILKNEDSSLVYIMQFGAIFLLSLFFLMIFYWVAFSRRNETNRMPWLTFITKFPMFLSVSMGLSLHNAIAVVEGYMGRKTPFIRTPKFNIKDRKDKWTGNKYVGSSLNLLTILEGVLSLYFFVGIVLAFVLGDFGLLPFHIMLCLGFGMVFYYSVYHSLARH